MCVFKHVHKARSLTAKSCPISEWFRSSCGRPGTVQLGRWAVNYHPTSGPSNRISQFYIHITRFSSRPLCRCKHRPRCTLRPATLRRHLTAPRRRIARRRWRRRLPTRRPWRTQRPHTCRTRSRSRRRRCRSPTRASTRPILLALRSRTLAVQEFVLRVCLEKKHF